MGNFSRFLRKSFFGLGRSIFPVLNTGNTLFIFRDADVREILDRDTDFTLEEINYENIARHIGPFMLGMDRGPQREFETGIMHQVLRPHDLDRIRDNARETSRQLISSFAPGQEFNLIREFTRIVPLRFTSAFFGTPGPDDETMLYWHRILFWDIFLNLKDDPKIRKEALQASPLMMEYLRKTVQERKELLHAGGEVPDDILSRLLSLQRSDLPSMEDDRICSNLAGTVMGAVEPISKAVVNILQELYARPEELTKAIAAAKSGDMDLLTRIVFEAYRFRPNLPVLIRYNKRDQYIGGKGRKKRKLKGGKKIYAFIASAMLDSRAWEDPKAFNPDRDRKKYLFFGAGTHYCYGPWQIISSSLR